MFGVALVICIALAIPIVKEDRRTSPTATLAPGAPPDFVTDMTRRPGIETMGVQFGFIEARVYGNHAQLRIVLQNTYDPPRTFVCKTNKYFGEGLYEFEELINVDLAPLEVGILTLHAKRASGKPLLRLVLNPWTRGDGGSRQRQRRFPEAQRSVTPEAQVGLAVVGVIAVGGGIPWDMTFTDDAAEAPVHPRYESTWKPS